MKPTQGKIHITITIAILAAILLVLVSVLIVLEVRNSDEQPGNTTHTEQPWDQSGAKPLEDYTWDEFLSLSPELQIAFQNAFGSEQFEEWMERVQAEEQGKIEYPWNAPGAKQPEDYTWEEFLALSPDLQIIFQNTFDPAALEAWMERAQFAEAGQNGYPWDQPNAKPLADYTWEEFLDLSPELQIAFQNAFGSVEFEKWLNRVAPQS